MTVMIMTEIIIVTIVITMTKVIVVTIINNKNNCDINNNKRYNKDSHNDSNKKITNSN